MPTYKEVCLIGSLKFYEVFKKVESMLKNEGIQSIGPIVYRDDLHSMLEDLEHPERIFEKPRTKEEERIGTKMHIANVATTDITYIISKEGYLGRSTSVEIGVAWSFGKDIYSMEKIKDASVEILVHGVLSPEELIKKIKECPITPG